MLLSYSLFIPRVWAQGYYVIIWITAMHKKAVVRILDYRFVLGSLLVIRNSDLKQQIDAYHRNQQLKSYHLLYDTPSHCAYR